MSSFVIPKCFKWSIEDFKDLYFTMHEFKKRFMQRQETGNKCKCKLCNSAGEVGCGVEFLVPHLANGDLAVLQHSKDGFELTYNPDDEKYYITRNESDRWTLGRFTDYRKAISYFKKLTK